MQKTIQKAIAYILTVSLLLSYLPMAVLAAESDSSINYDISSGSVAISEAGTYTITGSSSSNTVTISGDADITVILDGVSITSSSTAPINITNEGTTTITLASGTTNTLTSSAKYYSALQTAGVEGSELIINGEGALTANNTAIDSSGAGIGTKGNLTYVGGTITIESGTITAKNNLNGAAIGTGVNTTGKAVENNMTINITGGIVTATSRSGAAIGGGAIMDGGTINISGGIVTAQATYDTKTSYCGAGIGGGNYSSVGGGDAGTISITGGTINATSSYGEGIGRSVGAVNKDTLMGTLTIDGDAVIIANGGTATTGVSDIVGIDDETITATWNGTVNGTVYSTVPTFTVTYVDEDGTLTTKNVAQNTATTEPTDIAKAGYKVEGYYADTTYTTEFDFTDTIDTDTTIYVKWEEDTDTIAYVDSMAELTAALADDSNKSLIVVQDNITLTEDLYITRDVTIVSDGDYTIDSQSGENSIRITEGNVVLGDKNGKYTGTLTFTLGDGTYDAPAILVGERYNAFDTSLVMYDGIFIKDDTGISLGDFATFTMEGGEISGNTATKYGGVYLHPGATFIMNDGLISGNCASTANGGGIAANEGYIFLNAGTITNNWAAGNGLGDAVRAANAGATLYVSEKMIITAGDNGSDDNLISCSNDSSKNTFYSTITYNANGGSQTYTSDVYAIEDTIFSYIAIGETVDLDDDINFIRTGYTFKEWNTETDGSGKSYASDGSVELLVSITLYAIWDIEEYTVTFNSGDGGSTVGAQTVKYNDTATKPTTPTNDDYVFCGWYTDEDCTDDSEYDFTTPVTANITLYASWKIGYTVTFVNADNNTTYDTQGIVENEYATDITNPTRDGYTFVNWYSDEDCTTEFGFTTLITEDTTVYGKWTVNSYELTFDVAGVESITVTYGTEIGTLPSPTLENNDFGGWYIGTEEITENIVWSYTSDQTATALWGKSTTQTVYSQTQLEAAIADSDVTTIVVGGSFTLTSDVTFGRAVTLISNGNYTINNGDGTARFKITSTVNFGETGATNTLTLDLGGDSGVGVLVSVATGVLNMYDGIHVTGDRGIGINASGSIINMHGGTISGVTNTNSGNGGGVYISNGTFNMYGGTIYDNEATYGGGVYLTGTSSVFNMYGGSISDNTATTTGGGVYIASGTFNMSDTDGSNSYSGGTITGNTASSTAGGVYVTGTGATFTMNAGSITYNEATGGAGGGVFASNATFNMYGGEINYNTATGNGGGIVGGSASTLTLTAGTVYNNTSDAYGTAVRASGSTNITIAETMLISDNDTSDDDNLISIDTTGDVSITTTLTYDVNGGDGTVPTSDIDDESGWSDAGEAEVQSEFVDKTGLGYDLTAPKPDDDSEYTNLVFGGWNTMPDGSGTNYMPGDTISLYASVTLYANWQEPVKSTLTLSYYYPDTWADETQWKEETVDVTFGSEIDLGELADLSFDDATFEGWYIDGKQIKDGDIWSYSEDKTATAEWNLWCVDDGANLQTAVENADQDDIIKITKDIKVTLDPTLAVNVSNWYTAVSVDKPLTIKGAETSGDPYKISLVDEDGAPYYGDDQSYAVITYRKDITANNKAPLIIDNLYFQYGSSKNSCSLVGDFSLITAINTYESYGAIIMNCIFNDATGDYSEAYSAVYGYNVDKFVFENNVVNGWHRLAVYVNPNKDGTTTITDNFFLGTDGDDGFLHAISTHARSGYADITIKHNIFHNYGRAIDIGVTGTDTGIDDYTVDFTIKYNIFSEVGYAFDVRDANADGNNLYVEQTNIDLSENYFESGYDGIRMATVTDYITWIPILGDTTYFKAYNYATNANNLEFNNYYKKNIIPNITTSEDTAFALSGFDFTTTGTEKLSNVSYAYDTDAFYYKIVRDDGEVFYVTSDNVMIDGAGTQLKLNSDKSGNLTDTASLDDTWYSKNCTVQKISLNTTLPEPTDADLNMYDYENLLDSKIQNLILFNDLIINVSGTENIDENQSYIFIVKGIENTFSDGMSVTVTVHGNTSTTIKDLPIGNYTVIQRADWSWRYASSAGATDGNTSVTATDSTTVSFTQTRNSFYWLNGAAWCENLWGNGTITKDDDEDEVDE